MIEMNSSHEQKIWSEQAAAASVILDSDTLASIIENEPNIKTNADIIKIIASTAALYADEMIIEYRKRVPEL